MSEPEDILLDGAYRATHLARALRRRRPVADGPLRLAEVRPRLEAFISGAFGLSLPIVVAEAPARPTSLARLLMPLPDHVIRPRAVASTDGERLRLPRSVDAQGGLPPLAMYRLMAAGLAARIRRGAPQSVPPASSPLLRDLFLIREAAAADALLAREFPGLLAGIRAARATALAGRPARRRLTTAEAAVEQQLIDCLAGDPLDVDPGSPLDSLQGARTAAAGIAGRYRGLPPVPAWGEVWPAPPRSPAPAHDAAERPPAPARVAAMDRRPRVRQAEDDEDDERPGMWMIQLDDPQEHVEDPMGLQRPTDRNEDASAADLADSLSELPEARLVSTPGSPREVLASDDPPERSVAVPAAPGAIECVYPEWDYRTESYRAPGAVVREREAPAGTIAWADGVRTRNAALMAVVRRRFERLRPRRQRLGRQLDGAELDLDAFVTSRADLAAGRPADDRLYESVRPARRDVAVCLLVDVSASTDAWVAGNQRIVDVEKEALLVVADALDALGDPYAIYAFSGEGPAGVIVRTVKSFEEHDRRRVAQRIGALEPEHYTRMGAAIRHATARLLDRPARHRLLLVLSDGRPNDVDLYEGRYGIEDARRAVNEARVLSVHPFCLTVDRDAPAYLGRIFGASAFAVLREPRQLPVALVEVVKGLVSS